MTPNRVLSRTSQSGPWFKPTYESKRLSYTTENNAALLLYLTYIVAPLTDCSTQVFNSPKFRPVATFRHEEAVASSFLVVCANFGPDRPLLFKVHEIWSVDSQENHWNCCHQMPDFNAKMHQNWFRLGLRPRPRWGSLQRSPRPLVGFKGPTSKGMEGKGGKGRPYL